MGGQTSCLFRYRGIEFEPGTPCYKSVVTENGDTNLELQSGLEDSAFQPIYYAAPVFTNYCFWLPCLSFYSNNLGSGHNKHTRRGPCTDLMGLMNKIYWPQACIASKTALEGLESFCHFLLLIEWWLYQQDTIFWRWRRKEKRRPVFFKKGGSWPSTIVLTIFIRKLLFFT